MPVKRLKTGSLPAWHSRTAEAIPVAMIKSPDLNSTVYQPSNCWTWHWLKLTTFPKKSVDNTEKATTWTIDKWHTIKNSCKGSRRIPKASVLTPMTTKRLLEICLPDGIGRQRSPVRWETCPAELTWALLSTIHVTQPEKYSAVWGVKYTPPLLLWAASAWLYAVEYAIWLEKSWADQLWIYHGTWSTVGIWGPGCDSSQGGVLGCSFARCSEATWKNCTRFTTPMTPLPIERFWVTIPLTLANMTAFGFEALTNAGPTLESLLATEHCSPSRTELGIWLVDLNT